jgi:hypothetical protein
MFPDLPQVCALEPTLDAGSNQELDVQPLLLHRHDLDSNQVSSVNSVCGRRREGFESSLRPYEACLLGEPMMGLGPLAGPGIYGGIPRFSLCDFPPWTLPEENLEREEQHNDHRK